MIRKYLNLKELTLAISKTETLNSLLLNPVTKSETEKVINMFGEKKAVGPHNIPTNVMREYKKILSIPLALIINIYSKTGIFLELCETAHISQYTKRRISLTAPVIDLYLYCQI